MCNRLCLSTGLTEIKHHFNVVEAPSQLVPRWNIAPGSHLPVVRIDIQTQRRRLDFMHWGLIPKWAINPTVVRTTVSAGSLCLEMLWRRCIIPADNFYEWRLADGQPFAIALASGQMMPLAGIWDWWTSPTGRQIFCVAILTTEANSLLQPVCRDMPAILDPADCSLWLGNETSRDRPLSTAIRICPTSQLSLWPIHRGIRSRWKNDPSVLERMDIPVGTS
jgi:putative SOS response-associated peptidase YedK